MKKIVAFILILSFAFGSTVFGAAAISDVTVTHWAHSAIRGMVDAGHMTTIAGEFRPDAPIDKFETSRILASAAGATYALLDAAYETYGSTVAARAATYNRWNANADREIAFLLERGIFTESDLGNFIVRSGDAESLRALSRQEVAVYLVRLMGLGNEARNFSFNPDFTDAGRIQAAFRPYVYYLRSLGVISGEPGNNFNPNGIVTRGAMAVLLERSLGLAANQANQGTANVSNVTSHGGTGTVSIDSISGVIERVHTNINALQMRLSSGEIRILGMAPVPNIFVDGQRRTIHNLEEGMPIVGITRDGAIIDLQAQSAASPAGSNQAATETATPPLPANVEERILQGTVYARGQNTVTVEIRILNPHGFIITQRETLTVNANTAISRGGSNITLQDISVNDVISARIRGNAAHSLDIEERERHMVVTVLDRRTETTLGTNYFIVEDRQGNTHELVVNDDTRLTRQGAAGNVRFRDIRIGDTLDLIAEYSRVVEGFAYGTRGSADGIISEIHITRTGTSIMLIQTGGEVVRYHVIDGAFDVHNLRLNSRVRLHLDSREIEGFVVLPM
ncbi:MAG: S-layer homology domain-containing protein [Defluviitaleaceae bacterium]|nr:S-layer homology domain-containing protein [Defluviitaleaceae bacterium]